MYIMVRSQVCRGFRSTVSRNWAYLLRLCVYFHLRLEEVPTHHDGRRTRWQEHHWEGCLQICDPASEGASGNLLARAGWRLHGKLLLHYVACQNMAKWLASWQVYTSLHFLLQKAAYICWCDFAYPQAINAKESKGFKRYILAHIIVMSCMFWILWLDIVVSGCIWLFLPKMTASGMFADWTKACRGRLDDAGDWKAATLRDTHENGTGTRRVTTQTHRRLYIYIIYIYVYMYIYICIVTDWNLEPDFGNVPYPEKSTRFTRSDLRKIDLKKLWYFYVLRNCSP